MNLRIRLTSAKIRVGVEVKAELGNISAVTVLDPAIFLNPKIFH